MGRADSGGDILELAVAMLEKRGGYVLVAARQGTVCPVQNTENAVADGLSGPLSNAHGAAAVIM
jgi:hypothetical protein